MFFLALCFYLILLPALWFPLELLWSGTPAVLPAILAGMLALILAAASGRVLELYAPDRRDPLRLLLRMAGVRWICGLAVVGLAAAVAVQAISDKLHGGFYWTVAIPAATVFALNWIGIDFPIKRLAPEPKPELVTVTPPPEAPLPAAPSEPPSPSQPPSVPTPEPGSPPDQNPQSAPAPGWTIKSFRWTIKNTDYRLQLAMSDHEYQQRKSEPRVLDSKAWALEYVSKGISPEVRDLAAQLYRLGHPFGSQDEVEFVLAFVQHVIEYRSEEGEYPRFPVETLWEGGGDCEDYSILGAATLLCMGYRVAILLLPRHAALGVAGAEGLPGVYIEHDGARYFYCEMTGGGWRFGELPPDLRDQPIEVVSVPPPELKVVRPTTRGSNGGESAI